MSFVSDKVKSLPPYLFSEFQRKKRELENKGVDVIDLGIGAPDLPTPDFIIDTLSEEARKPENHRYSSFGGCDEYREAVAYFYKKEYGVDLDSNKEILTLIGSKEGLVNMIQAVINPGDSVLVPNPGYPAYRTGVHIAGGKTVDLPLDVNNGYVPLYEKITDEEIEKAKLMLLNYPGNPTAATIEIDTFEEAVAFAKENNILLAHDAAYDLVEFDDYKSPSVLQVEGAKETAIEFGSLSKSFNMTGWRIGYVVGNETVIQALAALKSNIDTCQFLPIQKAAAVALRSDRTEVRENCEIFKQRMEKLHSALSELGIKADKPKGTIFLWARVPEQFTSIEFANLLLEQAGVIITPGSLFGDVGEGFFRIALTVSSERLDEVISRLKQLNFSKVEKA